jgi:hypothetical protein
MKEGAEILDMGDNLRGTQKENPRQGEGIRAYLNDRRGFSAVVRAGETTQLGMQLASRDPLCSEL